MSLESRLQRLEAALAASPPPCCRLSCSEWKARFSARTTLVGASCKRTGGPLCREAAEHLATALARREAVERDMADLPEDLGMM